MKHSTVIKSCINFAFWMDDPKLYTYIWNKTGISTNPWRTLWLLEFHLMKHFRSSLIAFFLQFRKTAMCGKPVTPYFSNWFNNVLCCTKLRVLERWRNMLIKLSCLSNRSTTSSNMRGVLWGISCQTYLRLIVPDTKTYLFCLSESCWRQAMITNMSSTPMPMSRKGREVWTGP